ncbi:YlqD family protein [Alteribacillus sp. YIM 98480]|uniref:YlqD family protein n=1 Tax=Alteribacillus sp. YIM 98480 TaxID=2606599 RepID=UPI00131E7C92|nr:YlqD family protein [Alteribacillus sp. YIM 98480]
MRIIKKVTVKHVLTESLKEKMTDDFHEEQHRLEKEIEQLRFQMQKQWRAEETSRRKTEIKERFEKEVEKRKEKINRVVFQRSQLEQLPLFSEITAGQVDAIEEIETGDDWPLAEQEIIVEDGKIISIRNNRADDNNGMV